MVYSFTILLQLAIGIVSSIAVLGLCVSCLKKDDNKSELKKLALFFGFFALYSFSQSFPLLFSSRLEYEAWGFIWSVFFVHLMILVLFQTKIFYLNPLIKKIRPFFTLLVVVAGVFIMALLITDFRLPILDSSGWIIWNANPLAMWAFSLITAFTALLWSFAYFDSARFTDSLIVRVKAYILSLNGIIWALAVVLYFPSTSPAQISFAIVITLISLILTAFVFWVPRFLPKGQ